jgi:hypothetical protein
MTGLAWKQSFSMKPTPDAMTERFAHSFLVLTKCHTALRAQGADPRKPWSLLNAAFGERIAPV